MTDACSAPRARTRVCEGEVSPAERDEATAIDREREAEARRNAYYAAGGDEGGRCANASSDASAYAPFAKDDPHLKDARRTAAIDVPIESDPWGNAIIGAVAGGLVGGARAAAAEAFAPSLPAAPVAQHIAVHAAKHLVVKEALAGVRETTKMGPDAP